jgi:hypothetical protein
VGLRDTHRTKGAVELKDQRVWIATIFLIFLLYCTTVFLLAKLGVIEIKEILESATIFVGWLVTLVLAVIHLGATQKENEKGRREEIKRSLEVDAFRKINEALSNFSNVVTTVTTPYRTIPGSLRFSLAHNIPLTSLTNFFNVELPQQNIALWNGLTPFILAIESNEIAVIKYDHLRKYIQFAVDDAHDAINRFRDYIYSTPRETLLTSDGLNDLEKECRKVESKLFDVTMYLFDYRIELMNELLGDVFKERVPRRKPGDPNIKTLVELATPEHVKREEIRRDQARIQTGS